MSLIISDTSWRYNVSNSPLVLGTSPTAIDVEIKTHSNALPEDKLVDKDSFTLGYPNDIMKVNKRQSVFESWKFEPGFSVDLKRRMPIYFVKLLKRQVFSLISR